MELYIFARFHVPSEKETAMEAALADVLPPTREEDGCLSVHAFRSIRDPRLFYIHSRWTSEEAFELHATLPHTVLFIERAAALIDHPLDVTRAEMIS